MKLHSQKVKREKVKNWEKKMRAVQKGIWQRTQAHLARALAGNMEEDPSTLGLSPSGGHH